MQKKGNLYVISGPSGAGKGTIINLLINQNKNIKIAISATTRKARNNEIPEQSYYFLSKNEFQEKIKAKAFIEYCNVHDEFYGTLKSELETLEEGHDLIIEIDTQGAEKIKAIQNATFIFIAPPSINELKKRLIKRNTDSKDNIEKRINTAKKELQKIDIYDYVLINKEIKETIKNITKIIFKEKR
eukprot:COSAG01_NODE_52_length_31456_cov_125.226648_11_plen_186_part_00